MKSFAPTREVEAMMADLKASMAPVIKRHPTLGADIMLAVTAQLCGNLIALLDQTRYTAADAMELISQNIEIGNAAALAVAMVNGPPAGRA